MVSIREVDDGPKKLESWKKNKMIGVNKCNRNDFLSLNKCRIILSTNVNISALLFNLAQDVILLARAKTFRH